VEPADGIHFKQQTKLLQLGQEVQVMQGNRFLKTVISISFLISPALAQSNAGAVPSVSSDSQKPATTAAAPYHYHTERATPRRARLLYELEYGVDSLSARLAESGELVRFSYRVLDADKARILNDKQSEPTLYGERAHVKLAVPQLEKVGKLRQTSTPVEGKTYWMAFSNKGGYIKPGDHISVVIGTFRASGLIVE
jgi:hypothetical protein